MTSPSLPYLPPEIQPFIDRLSLFQKGSDILETVLGGDFHANILNIAFLASNPMWRKTIVIFLEKHALPVIEGAIENSAQIVAIIDKKAKYGYKVGTFYSQPTLSFDGYEPISDEDRRRALRFINDELSAYQSAFRQLITAEVPGTTLSPNVKLRMNLTVDELAKVLRLINEFHSEKLKPLLPKNMAVTDLTKIAAQIFETERSTDISANSLETKYHNTDAVSLDYIHDLFKALSVQAALLKQKLEDKPDQSKRKKI